jgi:hypothetical protein
VETLLTHNITFVVLGISVIKNSYLTDFRSLIERDRGFLNDRAIASVA